MTYEAKPISNKHLSIELWKMAKFFNGACEKLSNDVANLENRIGDMEIKQTKLMKEYNAKLR